MQVKGFAKDQLAVATLLFEGTAAEVEAQQKVIYEIAARHKGMAAGEGACAAPVAGGSETLAGAGPDGPAFPPQRTASAATS